MIKVQIIDKTKPTPILKESASQNDRPNTCAWILAFTKIRSNKKNVMKNIVKKPNSFIAIWYLLKTLKRFSAVSLLISGKSIINDSTIGIIPPSVIDKANIKLVKIFNSLSINQLSTEKKHKKHKKIFKD